MPTYEYESEDPPLRVVAIRSVSERDLPIILRRVEVPTSVSLANTDGGRSKELTLSKDVMAGYAKLEDSKGSAFGRKEKDRIRKAWEGSV